MLPVRHIPVAWQTQPLYGPIYRDVMPEGLSIAEIVGRVPTLPQQFDSHGYVCVNGDPVPRHMWRYVRPKIKAGEIDVVVTLHLRLHGGGGGGGGGSSGKSTIAIVASIALVAAAILVSAGALAPLLGPAFAAGQLGALLATAAISAGGVLLLTALAPPPVNPAAASTAGAIQFRAASLQGNTLQAGAPLPRVLGTKRIKPPFVTPLLTELVGDEEIAEAVYGLAGRHRIEDVRFGNVPASTMPEVQIEIQEGWPDSAQQSLVTRQSRSQSPQITLSNFLTGTTTIQLRDQGSPDDDVPHFHRVLTRDSPDEVWMRLVWQQGFYKPATPTASIIVPVRVRLRQRGTVTWINLPEIQFSNNTPNLFQKNVKIIFEAAPFPAPAVTGKGVKRLYKSVPVQTVTPAGGGGWTANSYFSKGAGNDVLSTVFGPGDQGGTSNVINCSVFTDRVEFYLDPIIFPKDFYEIEIIRGQCFTDANFTENGYFYTPRGASAVVDFFGYWANAAVNQLQEDPANFQSDVQLLSVSNIWNENPIALGAGIALIAVKIKGRSAEQLSALCSGFVQTLVGTDWDVWDISSNPVDHYRDVLLGDLGSFTVATSSVDTDELIDWRLHCSDLNYQINAVVEGQKELDVLTIIAAAGWAKFRQSELIGVAQDRDRTADTLAQVFTPRNLTSFRWERGFGNLPDGFIVKWDDIQLDYEENELVILDPDAPTQGIRLEQIRYEVLVTQAEVVGRALFDLKQLHERAIFYFGEAQAEQITSRRGDLVAVQHDCLTSWAGFAYVDQVLLSGPNVIGLVLDDSLPTPSEDFFTGGGFFTTPTAFFDTPPRFGLMIRQLDGTTAVYEVLRHLTDEDSTSVTFVTPFTNPGTSVLDVGCMVTSGLLGQEYKRMIVANVAPKENLSATVALVDEAPALWTIVLPPSLLDLTWTPAQLPGLVAWYSADFGVFSDAGVTPAVNGNPVRQWNDRSGNGYHLKQATLGSRPTFTASGLGGLPTIDFANTNTAFPAGTNIGNMTGGGGLAAAFNGNTSQTQANSASTSSTLAFGGGTLALHLTTDGYVGKNETGVGGTRVSYAVCYPSNNNGFWSSGLGDGNSSTSLTLKLRAKATAPVSPSDGTLLASAVVTTDSTTNTVTLTSSDQSTVFNYVWVEFVLDFHTTVTTGGGGSVTVTQSTAEVQLFSPTSGQGMHTDADTVVMGTGSQGAGFALGKLNADAGARGRLLSYKGNASANDHDNTNSAVFVERNNGLALDAMRNSNHLSGTASILYGTFYRTGSNFDGALNRFYLNNSPGPSVVNANSWTTPGTLNVGENTSADQASRFDGSAAEIVVTSVSISDSDRSKWDQYLRLKYGI